mgnify:CR=1 FL=1
MVASEAPHFSQINIADIKFGGVKTVKYSTAGTYTSIDVKYKGQNYFTFRTGLYDIRGYKLKPSQNQKEGRENYVFPIPLEDASEEEIAFKKFLSELDAAFVKYCTEEGIFDDTQAIVASRPYRKGALVNQPRATLEGSNAKVEVAKPRVYANCVPANAPLGKNGKAPPPTEFTDIAKNVIPWTTIQKCNVTGYIVLGANRATVTVSSSGIGIDMKGMIVTSAKVAPRGNRLAGLVDELYADKKAAQAEAAKLRKQLKKEIEEEEAAQAAEDGDDGVDVSEAYVPAPANMSDDLFKEIEAMEAGN